MKIPSLYSRLTRVKILFIVLSVSILGVTGLTLYSPFRSWVTAQVAGQSIEVSPPTQEVVTDPGKTVTISAKITNKTNNSLTIQVHIEDFLAKGDEGLVALSTGSPYSISSWTKVSPDHLTLAPNEQKEVQATIKVPLGVAGGRYGSFVFGTAPQQQGGAAVLSQEIASLFLVRINGNVHESLDITELKAPSYSEFGPIPVTLKFANHGNVHVKAYGLINVTDMFGNKVEDIVVKQTNVFPDANRLVTVALNKKFLIGSYKATALIYYGSDQLQTLSSTTKFFVFPTRLAAGLVIILFFIFLMRKRLKKALRALFK